MKNKEIEKLLAEAKRLKEKIKKLEEKYQDLEMDNEDTWGGHDGPMAMGYENERRLLDEMLAEVNKELEKLGFRVK